MPDNKLPIYDPTRTFGRLQHIMAWVSVVAATLTALAVIFALVTGYRNAQAMILTFAAIWAVAPPIWFFLEYFYIYPEAGRPETWESFKYGQQVAIAVWAGATATLYGLGSSDLAKPKKETIECVMTIPPETSTTAGSPIRLQIECPKR